MDLNRKLWNDRHQKLNRAFAAGDREKAIDLFLGQHAMVHAARVSRSKLWSFEDELLYDMTDDEIRRIPAGGEHSIAWILFHLARIEDITMNMLIAGSFQLFRRDDWAKKMNVDIIHSANGMNAQSVVEMSASLNIKSLCEYRVAVARRTRDIIKKLQAKDFKQKVEPSRIEKVLSEGAVIPEAIEIIHYWSRKTIAGLLLMPPTRHCILHLNEGSKVKEKIRKIK